jgi:Kef-type K+ transport system membrane component KefB
MSNATVEPQNAAAPAVARHGVWQIAAYVAMIGIGLAVLLAVLEYGRGLVAPAAAGALEARGRGGAAAFDPLPQLIITLGAVIVLGRVIGRLFRRVGQPLVLAEMIAGMLLGPTILGAVWPEAQRAILPVQVIPFLDVVAKLGIVFYMFLVGLELDLTLIRRHVNAMVMTSHASIVLPFVLGALLSVYLYPRFASGDVPFTSFTLLVAIAMSITAFPVLARILSEVGLMGTRLGGVALTCAAVDDVSAWCLLAVVIGVLDATAGSAARAIALTVVFVAAMFLLVRPWIARWVRARGDEAPGSGQVALVIVGAMVAALITERIGVHALFGAFLFGVAIPHDSPLARTLTRNLDAFVSIILLPAFFALAGARIDIGLLNTREAWLATALILLVATLGKVGGSMAAARACGLGWRPAAALGVLMNTRGVMLLIVLNLGLDIGVLTPTLFTMMVLMALVATFATAPLVRMLVRHHDHELT